ncbi:hypothetical protein IV203_023090 [Nitzschia inconspicua]|uniref:Uncharacterized protein n=1 Tax=Nitzschia inconspicua TaxID=303405 RepID=A0A9K3KD83_9STRA|nr:hypothetical protein IV203_023090 [Nitzschia inconspicua]
MNRSMDEGGRVVDLARGKTKNLRKDQKETHSGPVNDGSKSLKGINTFNLAVAASTETGLVFPNAAIGILFEFECQVLGRTFIPAMQSTTSQQYMLVSVSISSFIASRKAARWGPFITSFRRGKNTGLGPIECHQNTVVEARELKGAVGILEISARRTTNTLRPQQGNSRRISLSGASGGGSGAGGGGPGAGGGGSGAGGGYLWNKANP